MAAGHCAHIAENAHPKLLVVLNMEFLHIYDTFGMSHSSFFGMFASHYPCCTRLRFTMFSLSSHVSCLTEAGGGFHGTIAFSVCCWTQIIGSDTHQPLS